MKKEKFVYTVSSADEFNCYPEGLEAVFDTLDAAKAYIQHRIDSYKLKHKCEYGGEWETEKMPFTEASAKVRSESRHWYVMYIEKHRLYTKDDIKELE